MLKTIDRSKTSGESVEIKLVPLSAIQKLDGLLWDKNPKKHDIDSIIASIQEYGFVDPPHWDNALNGGSGGIVFGNGRTKAIVQALIAAQNEGLDPPRGIPVTAEGEWCVPISFGVNQESEAAAIALGIDHNNLTLMPGFDTDELAKIWDSEGYSQLLVEVAEAGLVPVSVDENAIAALLTGLGGDMPEYSDMPQSEPPKEKSEILRLSVSFENSDDRQELYDRLVGEGYNCRI